MSNNIIDYKSLIETALKVRRNAYTPYSGFKVGATLLSKRGVVYTGINIESASYTPTNCAERTAFFKAVSEGEREFLAIAIVGGFENSTLEYCYPCGVCRQVMAEFCNKDFEIIAAKGSDDYEIHKLSELFPFSFGPDDLTK